MNRKLLLAVLPALVCVSVSARAGFEWVPPTKLDTPQAAVAAPAVPDNAVPASFVPMPDKPVVTTTREVKQTTVTNTASQDMAPTPLAPPAPDYVVRTPDPVITAPAPTPAPVVATVPATRMGVSGNGNAPRNLTAPIEPVYVEPAPVIASTSATTTAVTTTTTAAAVETDLIQGFGRDVPLTIATRQIIPTGHTVQYAPGVDPNMNVTWSGGRSWKEVLNDALAEKNLKATIVADSVLVEPVGGADMLRAEPLAPAALPPIAQEVQVADLTPASSTTTVTTTTATDMVPDVAVQAAPAAMPANQMWVAPRASTLRQVLTDWSREAGVQLQWSAQYDYPLMSDVQIAGSFEQAVETLLSGLVDAQPRPVARLHPNEPSGPAILVIETRHILE